MMSAIKLSGFAWPGGLSARPARGLGWAAGRLSLRDRPADGGAQAAFYDDPRVLTISLHQDPAALWPGTGLPSETGGPGAKELAANLALPTGTGDAGWLRAFRPAILVSQHGCDTRRLDPLASFESGYDPGRSPRPGHHGQQDSRLPEHGNNAAALTTRASRMHPISPASARTGITRMARRADCGVGAAVDVHYLRTGGALAAAALAADAAFAHVLAERTDVVARLAESVHHAHRDRVVRSVPFRQFVGLAGDVVREPARRGVA